MVWKANELLVYLSYLSLCGQEEDGDLQWLGTKENFQDVEYAIKVEEELWTK